MKTADMIEAAKLAGVLVGGYLAWRAIAAAVEELKKKGPGGVAAAAVSAVGDAAAGAVKGVSSLVGIPDTDAQKCAAAKAAGDTWSASFYCPAGDWLTYVVSPSASAQKRVATKDDADAWASAKESAYGQQSFLDTINSDPYNLIP